MGRIKLSDAMLADAIRWWESGWDYETIGRKLGVTGPAIRTAFPRIGYKAVRYPAWTISDCHGYASVYMPEAHSSRLAHRLVMEHLIGRRLRRGEIVHHINGNKRDNRPCNLELFPSISAHMKHHVSPANALCVCGTKAWRIMGGDTPVCSRCYGHARWYHRGGASCSLKQGQCPMLPSSLRKKCGESW